MERPNISDYPRGHESDYTDDLNEYISYLESKAENLPISNVVESKNEWPKSKRPVNPPPRPDGDTPVA